MTIKPLAITLVAASILSACGSLPTKSNNATNKEAIVFTEPDISAPFYPLNPFNYNAPPAFEVELQQAAAQPVTKVVINLPSDPSKSVTLDTNRLIVPTVNSKSRHMKYAALAGNNELDVTDIDDFLLIVEGKARHYPPQFTSRQERKGYERKLKEVSQQLDVLAAANNASYDVLLRAFKASVMGRNLDLGAAYTTKSLDYAQRLLKLNQTDPETNFWFGFGLSEGGGQREALKYLNNAMQGGVQEAYLVAANNYLGMEQKKNAIQILQNYKLKYPQEAQVTDRLIKEIQTQGRWNVWQLMTPKN
ncbi:MULTISPECIES: ABUW_2363 family tetratricopeptide repeat lipoprotein [unclassified Acinetobacter]|uniref:ABUW_2363 family tetratricopeptide repeat lipoprotein n=1 Tax=unclassified Acinetobacter TaxID=196816 RepID=UPI002934129A|nr:MULTISPECIES: hypothetical protein [unclassified Acinetobacter]WOE31798.1 hypothetical protein QSG84_00830 [Acinetobacter sp. SAAs470]WOE37265.1 hypothetical protein QSG86_09875 [Acinetobacter sp. SAAs474]